jgi:ankyrin repeat protein
LSGEAFELAADAVVEGNLDGLRALLLADPELARACSSRPHHATLLHYISANGVEDERQRTPPNAVAVANLLLEAGADPNACADAYGGRCTVLSLLVSSTPPAVAGLQVALVDSLVDAGASVEPLGVGAWTSPLMTALAFGFHDTAEALVRRGARVDSLPLAAGLGSENEVVRMLPTSTAEERHRALAVAAQHGHVAIVEQLLDAGEDPNRFNPSGLHAHSTPLHQAALKGHLDVVRALVERGARSDVRDKIYDGTPLGWAIHGGQAAVAEYLRARGAP